MNDAPAATPYDEVSYPSYTHTYSHPDRLATAARLWGMNPAPVTACRVLELGCGDGSNLIPMAFGLPGSRFVGLDLSAKAVERGQEAIRDLGLTNVELRHADILHVDASWGKFDYLIAHGVFSWVPPEVREKVLTICRENLAPQGVAFISYLAYPGSHVRAMLRDMMLYRAGDTADPERILAAGREMAAFIAHGGPPGDIVQSALQGEAARVEKSVPHFLFHDDLADWNAPFYFVQFNGMAQAHGLQFLSEADPTEMVDYHLPENVRKELARLAPDRIQREQYLDFLKARRFRQTLLCHAEIAVQEPDPCSFVPEMWVSSSATGPKEEIDLTPGVEVAFVSPRGPKLDTALPMGKAAMNLLVKSWPQRLPFAEILETVLARMNAAGVALPEDDGEPASRMALFLHHLHEAGMVQLHTDPTRQMPVLTDRPCASSIARWQAARGNRITTLRHVGLTFDDEPTMRLISLMDGTRSQEELVSIILPTCPPAADGRTLTAEDVMERLRRLAQEGILIG